MMMPTRRRTRAADRARRIREQRTLNAAHRAQYAATNTTECDKPPPTEPWNIDTNTDAGDEPPPF